MIRLKANSPDILHSHLDENREYGLMNWMPILSAPFDRDLELAVINRDGEHALAFPCRRVVAGWTKKDTGELVEVHPTHWRAWQMCGGAAVAFPSVRA